MTCPPHPPPPVRMWPQTPIGHGAVEEGDTVLGTPCRAAASRSLEGTEGRERARRQEPGGGNEGARIGVSWGQLCDRVWTEIYAVL